MYLFSIIIWLSSAKGYKVFSAIVDAVSSWLIQLYHYISFYTELKSYWSTHSIISRGALAVNSISWLHHWSAVIYRVISACVFNPLRSTHRVNPGGCLTKYLHVHLCMLSCVFRAALHWHMVMVLFPDSLGQCVSALSKQFTATESIRDTVNCLPPSHREKHSEVRHRKDAHHQQEDTPKLKVKRTIPAGIVLLK